jgi:hypothetical protein
MRNSAPWWRGLVCALTLVVVAGCAAQTPAATMTGPATSVDVAQREDAAFGDVVVSTGLDSGTAAFMMLAESTTKVIDGHTFVVRQAFPNGATAKAAYHLYTGGGGIPGQPPSVTSTRSANDFRFTLSYALALADLRLQVLAGLPGGAPAQPVRDAALAALGLARPALPIAGRAALPEAPPPPSTVDVMVDGVISQAQESGIDKTVNTTQLDKTQAGTSWEAYKAGKKVWDALDANASVADALQSINAARDCAVNPTNPLTRQQYQDNPAARDALVKQIDEIHDEVTQDAAVLFVELFTDAGAGLVKAAPWLGFITSPATNYMKETLGSSISGRVRAAQQLVPACRKISYRVTGGGGGVTVNATIGSVKAPFTVNGAGNGFVVTFSMTPGDATGTFGNITYEGSGSGVTMSGTGEYTISGKDPGPYQLQMTVSGCVDGGQCSTNTDTWKLTPQTTP